jgi:hypothetical protein
MCLGQQRRKNRQWELLGSNTNYHVVPNLERRSSLGVGKPHTSLRKVLIARVAQPNSHPEMDKQVSSTMNGNILFGMPTMGWVTVYCNQLWCNYII